MLAAIEKTKEVLRRYAEGGSVREHIFACGISWRDFRRVRDSHPDLEKEYRTIEAIRAESYVDEAYETAQKSGENPQAARVKADILVKLAGLHDRPRFGDKLDMTVDQTVSVSGALQAAKARALRPPRDLGAIADAEVVEPSQLPAPHPTDTQSEGAAIVPDPAIDPFS